MKKFLICSLIAIVALSACKKEVYHNITISANPSEGGTVSPSSGPVLEGTSVSFKAAPNGEYVFTGWSGSLSGTENPMTVTVNQDMNVTANFELRSYPLTISKEGDGNVSEKVISVKSDYKSGTVVELTATPSEHWLFDHWEEDLSGNANPIQISITEARSVKAVFVKKMYSLNIQIEGEGAVDEKIVDAKSSYQEGTKVELTANSSQGWSFNHWEGDLEGNENPVQITVFEEMTVKAVFTKNNYSINIKIEGPGVVDEYLAEQTKSSLEYGAQVRLVAIPSKGAKFEGWSGDLSGTDKEISIMLNEDKEIVATFSDEVKKYDFPNLLIPTSIRKGIFYDVNFPGIESANYCALDYNLDGYIDIVTCFASGDPTIRLPIQFYQGQKDGSFVLDETNSNKFYGLIAWRKSLYGDFNGDGIPDICFVGHGWDAEPWPGEYPVLLLSSPNGQYAEHRYEDVVGYYHGSAAGDFDNDGDLDLVLIDHSVISKVLVNDGKGNMTVHDGMLNTDVISGSMYTCELFDINHDGYLDLIVGGHEHEGKEWHMYTNQTCVFWGNGTTFNNDNYVRLPSFSHGWGVTLDYIFYDLDGDGREEIINVRTGDGLEGQESYRGWNIQIVSYDGDIFKDVTTKFIKQGGCDEGAVWLIKIYMEEVDGSICLVGLDAAAKKHKLFRLKSGILERCKEEQEEETSFSTGTCLYSDGFGMRGEHANLGCREESYSGLTSIHFQKWPTWNGWSIDYPNFMDFSKLEKNNYYLEFAIKNIDPDLVISFSFETRIQTDPWYFPTYSYTYWGNEHKSDGSWELIQVPLSSLKCDEEWTGYYWNTIKTINIMPGECHGKDFYLDEIRIRKILP